MVKLYRAHSSKYFTTEAGILINKNLTRTRTPRDTDPKLHKIAGDWFTKKFGKDYRAHSLFCTGDRGIAEGYRTVGKTLVELRPLGDFSLCYSPNCKDLFGHFQFKPASIREDESAITRELEDLDFVEFHNSGLDAAAATGSEVMIIATSFHYQRIN